MTKCGGRKETLKEEAGSEMGALHSGDPESSESYAIFCVCVIRMSAKTPDPLSSNKISAYSIPHAPLPAPPRILASR